MSGPAMLPPEERPLHLRVTQQGVKLRFFHTTKAIPPFKINLPIEQWEQIVQLVAATKRDTPEWEGYVGFNEQLLALHRIDAVPAE